MITIQSVYEFSKTITNNLEDPSVLIKVAESAYNFFILSLIKSDYSSLNIKSLIINSDKKTIEIKFNDEIVITMLMENQSSLYNIQISTDVVGSIPTLKL